MRLLRSLLSNPRSLRALDETVADRQLELATAATALARSLCHLRSALAVLRVFGMSLPREVAQPPLFWLAARGLLFAIPAALALMVARQDIVLGFRGQQTIIGVFQQPDLTRRIIEIFVIALGGFMPLAWFLAAAWPLKRRPPVFAFGTVVFLLSIAQNAHSLGFVVPSAMNAWTIVLMAIAASYAANLALLGAAVAQLSRTQRWIWRLGVPALLMVWMRVSVWMTGWDWATATLESSIAMVGTGILMVAIIGGTALWLFAQDREGPPELAPGL